MTMAEPLPGDPKEYTWIDYDAKNPTPATAISANNGNVKVDVNDRRANEAYVAVEVGKPFTVALDDQNGVIDHYYVVLDKDFAGESGSFRVERLDILQLHRSSDNDRC